MRKVVVSEFITVDGVIEEPGERGWAFQFERGPEGDKLKLDEVMAADALLLGRITYEGFAQAWPSMTDEVGFADKFNNMPKYVVSKTLETAEWTGSTIVRGDPAEEVPTLKEDGDGDLLVAGSGQLTHSLIKNDLVDELRLMVFPILLGEGRRLFPDDVSVSKTLKLTESKPLGGDGVLYVTYERAA
jgi:dihydrofolate reductase